MFTCVKYLFISLYFCITVKTSKETCLSAEQRLKMALEEHSVVPDVIPVALGQIVHVTYAENVKVIHGNTLTPTQAKDIPNVKWNMLKDSYYTLCLTDPDAPSRESPTLREWHHWLVGNIIGCGLEDSDTLTQYIGPEPPMGSGPHRYVFVVFKQIKRIEFHEPILTNRTGIGRGNFSIMKFAKKYEMGDPVAVNFFLAEWDDSVPTMYKQLQLS